MGRTKGTLICKKCRRTNPETMVRVLEGCHHCHTLFEEDRVSRNHRLREIKRKNLV